MEECRELDDDHEGSWPCLQLSATAIAASVLHKVQICPRFVCLQMILAMILLIV